MEVGSDTDKQRLLVNAKDTTQEAEKHNRIQSRSANPFRRGRRVLQSQPEFVCERLETDFVQTFGPEETNDQNPIWTVFVLKNSNRKSVQNPSRAKRPEPDLDAFRVQIFGPKKRPESERSAG